MVIHIKKEKRFINLFFYRPICKLLLALVAIRDSSFRSLYYEPFLAERTIFYQFIFHFLSLGLVEEL